MKRLFFILSLFLLPLTAFARTNEFFGLKLGHRYTLVRITEVIGGKSAFDERIDTSFVSNGIHVNQHTFSNARYSGTDYQKIIVQSLDDGTIASIGYGMKSGTRYTDSVYVDLLNRYPNREKVKDGMVQMYLSLDPDNMLGINMIEYYNTSGQMESFQILYSDMKTAIKSLSPGHTNLKMRVLKNEARSHFGTKD